MNWIKASTKYSNFHHGNLYKPFSLGRYKRIVLPSICTTSALVFILISIATSFLDSPQDSKILILINSWASNAASIPSICV